MIDFAHAEMLASQIPSVHDAPAIPGSYSPLDADQRAINDGRDATPQLASEIEDANGGRSRGSTVSSQARPVTPPAAFTRTTVSAKTSIAPSAEHTAPIMVTDLTHENPSTTSIR